MQPEQQTMRQIIRHLQSSQVYHYLTPSTERQKLEYDNICLGDPQHPERFSELLGLDCQMVTTNQGPQLCRVIILSGNRRKFKVTYDKWFNVKQGSIVTDYLTHITGLTEQILNSHAPKGQSYTQKDKQQIQKLIQGKVLVGHDLHNDIQVLKIKHQAFIDTVSLFPHNLGLPYKSKLQHLALNVLKKRIQWGSHNPIQDAQTALQLAHVHIADGRGIIYAEPFPKKKYNSPWEVIKDAQLNPQKILFFVLRGSRALDLVVQVQGYKSDYDYVVVYDTTAQIDGRLIKLPDIDVSFFDKQSYKSYLRENDISYLQLFFLPQQYIFVNKLKQPTIKLRELRKSLGFHLNKAKMKYKRIMPLIQENKAYEWKILKTVHMKMRFMDNFLQILSVIKERFEEQNKDNLKSNYQKKKEEDEASFRRENRRVQRHARENNKQNMGCFGVQNISINIKRLKSLWDQTVKLFNQTKDFQLTLRNLQKKQKQMKTQVNEGFSLQRGLRYRGRQDIDRQYKNEQLFPKSKDISTAMDQQFFRSKYNQDQRSRMPPRFRGRTNKEKMQELELGKYSSLPNSKPNPVHQKLQTIKILRQYGVQAIEEYRVIAKQHRAYQNLIELHYLNSASFNSAPPRQCRGLILDQSNNFSVVAMPYTKFFDYNDPKYSQIKEFDWDSAKIYQKKDGSLAFLYFYDWSWHVASSTIPDGMNQYCFGRAETKTQFRQEFWKIFYQKGFKLPGAEDRNKTFVFQLMSKNHIIVVKREQNDLCLHGVRDIATLQEQDHIPYGEKYNWNVAKPLDIKYQSIQDLVKMTEQLDPLKSQGFVVCDKNWIRMKIKSSSYVRINWLGELNLGFNKDPKKYILIQIILSGQAQIFSKYCPEWATIIQEYLEKIKKINSQIIQIYQRIKNLPKKQFARQAQKYSKDYQTFLFAVRGKQQLYYGKVQDVMNPKKFYAFLRNYK